MAQIEKILARAFKFFVFAQELGQKIDIRDFSKPNNELLDMPQTGFFKLSGHARRAAGGILWPGFFA
jgi:hypothetical protein